MERGCGEERDIADGRDNEPRSNFPSYGSLCVLKCIPSIGNFGELGFTARVKQRVRYIQFVPGMVISQTHKVHQ